MARKYGVRGLDRHGRKWRLRRQVDGRRVVHSFEAASEAEAIQKALELLDRIDLQEAGGWAHEVRRYIEHQVAGGLFSRSTAERREGILLLLPGQAEIEHPRQMTPARLRRWYEDRRGEVSTRSANDYLKAVRCFLAWLVEQRKLVSNPAAEVREVRVQEVRRERFLEREEVAQLLEEARRRGDPELELILLLACECGMRRGEIAAAGASWVDLKRGTITIPAADQEGRWKRKGREGRRRAATVPLVGALVEWFERHGVPAPYLLRPEKEWGGHRYRYDFESKVRRLLQAEGFEGVTIHDLRRSFGSNRVSAGVSLEKVANWLGIAPATAWKHYARFRPGDAEIEKGSAGQAAVVREPEERPRPAAGLAERLAQLQELERAGLVSAEEAAARRREILAEL